MRCAAQIGGGWVFRRSDEALVENRHEPALGPGGPAYLPARGRGDDCADGNRVRLAALAREAPPQRLRAREGATPGALSPAERSLLTWAAGRALCWPSHLRVRCPAPIAGGLSQR
jgi:hypothetical protein